MASVKRYRHVGSRMMETIKPVDGEYVLASDYDRLVDLVRHCQIHSGFRNCGYSQMTTKQKELYDSLIGEGGEEATPLPQVQATPTTPQEPS